MLTRHPGLFIVLLFSVAAHASLTDRWFAHVPHGKQLGFALLFAPILIVMLGEWIAQDATGVVWRRRGSALALTGALLHLLLDGASLALLGQRLASPWLVGLGGGAGALLMAWIAYRAWRGVVSPGGHESSEDPAASPPPAGWLPRLLREASLFGSTAAMVCLVGLGMVALAAVGLWRHPEAWPKMIGAASFFILCALVGVWMGLDRRAMLLRQPPPFLRLRPRWLQRSIVVPTQEGLALLGRKGATIYSWEAIRAVSLGEYANNPAVFIDLGDSTIPRRFLPDGSEADPDPVWLRRQSKNHSLQRMLAGCDLLIMGVMTEAGPGVLADQISTLLCDYEGRAKLPAAASAQRAFVAKRSSRS